MKRTKGEVQHQSDNVNPGQVMGKITTNHGDKALAKDPILCPVYCHVCKCPSNKCNVVCNSELSSTCCCQSNSDQAVVPMCVQSVRSHFPSCSSVKDQKTEDWKPHQGAESLVY